MTESKIFKRTWLFNGKDEWMEIQSVKSCVIVNKDEYTVSIKKYKYEHAIPYKIEQYLLYPDKFTVIEMDEFNKIFEEVYAKICSINLNDV